MISGIFFRGNKLLCLLIAMMAASAALAQKTNTFQVADSSVNKDSTKYISFLIVPFNPAMYFSDADADIADVSKIEPGKVRDKFNGSLEANIADKLENYYDVKRLSKQTDAADDIDLIFGSISYSPEEKKAEKEPAKDKLQNLKKKMQKEGEKSEDKETYMNIGFADQRLTNFLADKYGVQYLVFINQFEIKTDYENCIDLQLRKYYREIKVHYTVVDRSGSKVSGDVLTIPYHNNENNVETIVKDNFGKVSNEIFSRLYLRK